MKLRDEEYSYSSISGKLAAIFLFYDINDIVLNKKKICRYIGEHEKTTCQNQRDTKALMIMYSIW